MGDAQPTTLYFAYGSNLWLDQMDRRCPESTFRGIAILRNWRWIINGRGYANVIPSESDLVYGMIYEINPADEASLDIYEGVPVCYEKQIHPVEFLERSDSAGAIPMACEALVYVDIERKEEDKPKKEYIYRMNMAIEDSLEQGIPDDYIDRVLRPFIPSLLPSNT